MSDMDQTARDMAKDALAKIESHESVCEVRWREAYAAIKDLKAYARTQMQLNMAAQAFVILTLMSLIAWLANRGH